MPGLTSSCVWLGGGVLFLLWARFISFFQLLGLADRARAKSTVRARALTLSRGACASVRVGRLCRPPRTDATSFYVCAASRSEYGVQRHDCEQLCPCQSS